MRSRTRRSFFVEIKSTGRRQATIIPSRVAPPAARASRLFRETLAEMAPPQAEPRRILPNLIVPKPPQELMPAPAAEDLQQRRHGRPRKVPVSVVEAVTIERGTEAVIAAAPAAPACSKQSPPAPVAAKRTMKPMAVLAPGERWKRRLGRWAR